jgi:hypothetical protein
MSEDAEIIWDQKATCRVGLVLVVAAIVILLPMARTATEISWLIAVGLMAWIGSMLAFLASVSFGIIYAIRKSKILLSSAVSLVCLTLMSILTVMAQTIN